MLDVIEHVEDDVEFVIRRVDRAADLFAEDAVVLSLRLLAYRALFLFLL